MVTVTPASCYSKNRESAQPTSLESHVCPGVVKAHVRSPGVPWSRRHTSHSTAVVDGATRSVGSRHRVYRPRSRALRKDGADHVRAARPLPDCRVYQELGVLALSGHAAVRVRRSVPRHVSARIDAAGCDPKRIAEPQNRAQNMLVWPGLRLIGGVGSFARASLWPSLP